jgi:hypothetical protein
VYFDGYRQGLVADIDDDAKCERGILLDGALGPARDHSPETVLVGRAGAAIESEQRLARGYEIAHAGANSMTAFNAAIDGSQPEDSTLQ